MSLLGGSELVGRSGSCVSCLTSREPGLVGAGPVIACAVTLPLPGPLCEPSDLALSLLSGRNLEVWLVTAALSASALLAASTSCLDFFNHPLELGNGIEPRWSPPSRVHSPC